MLTYARALAPRMMPTYNEANADPRTLRSGILIPDLELFDIALDDVPSDLLRREFFLTERLTSQRNGHECDDNGH